MEVSIIMEHALHYSRPNWMCIKIPKDAIDMPDEYKEREDVHTVLFIESSNYGTMILDQDGDPLIARIFEN